MLLYIHVPFCRRKCRYCAFYSEPLSRSPGEAGGLRLRAYQEALMLEIARWGDRLGKREVETVFFGGGTPSLLPASSVASVLDRVRRAFRLLPDAEITLEANPESLSTRAGVRAYLSAGINRLSLGIQSTDDRQLELLGRPHRADEGLHAYYAAREAGCANINLDLIWGLPGQKPRQWLDTVRQVCDMRPDHVSAYGLTLEEGTPLAADCEIGRLSLPGEREQALMYMQGSELLEEAGIMQYEVSNYARMGFQCRHNLGYWEGAEYLGLGPAASSTLGGRRWSNPADFSAWGRAVTRNEPVAEVEILDLPTRALELVMLRLRTVRGLRLKAYRDITGRDFMADHRRLAAALHRNGLIRIMNGYLRLTRSGMLVSNSILGNLFEAVEKTVRSEALPAAPPSLAHSSGGQSDD